MTNFLEMRNALRSARYRRQFALKIGRLDAKSMITKTYQLADGRQAVQDVADRTVITAVILFASFTRRSLDRVRCEAYTSSVQGKQIRIAKTW